jgi:hypothetical protein
MEKSLKLKSLVLRCYAEQDNDGSWFAICLDLNVYARGDDFQEVQNKLSRRIHEYVSEALGEDSQYIGSLIPRKAPAYFWIKYWLFTAMTNAHPSCTMLVFRKQSR